LDLSSNRLTGVFNISTICKSFQLIEKLNLSRNQLNGTLDFRQLSSTVGVSVPILDLSFNNFSGDLLTINTSNTNLASFGVLLLNNNQLTGDFPNLTLATQLTTLDLSFNKLSGSLPPSIWASPNISVLDLSENNFSNNLPNLPVVNESIFICPKSLTNLNLAGNSLNGSFPSELLNCSTKLQVINCDGNAFSGALNMNVNTSALSGELSMVNNDISELIPSWESGRYSPVLLGGNPICKAISNGCPNNEFIVYDNPSQNENFDPQLNCRYNSSQPFIIRGEF
jgi:Leucine-rich repeat (LRR) protein